MFSKLLPYDAASLILSAYIAYYQGFKRITKRGQIRFEYRDWHGIQADAVERLTLYREFVGRTVEELKELLGDKAQEDQFWLATKHIYFEEIVNFNTRNIAETFFNSVFRHAHIGLSADEDLMFVHATGNYRDFKSRLPIYHTFFLGPGLEGIMRQILRCYPFDAPFKDKTQDTVNISNRLRDWIDQQSADRRNMWIEVLKAPFFRNKAAYIVGRICVADKKRPFIIPLLHDEEGIFADTLLLTYNDVSSIFSYHRSHFLVDVDIVRETVDFLASILPTKGLGELYNSIGFEKHGKTVFYRDFLRHLAKSSDRFVKAPGIEGMVMSVFTMHSYDVVFKVIKDKFDPSKQTSEKKIKEKYDLVHRHDRVGRMTDFHTFEHLVFERSRFSQSLLDDLSEKIGSKLILTDKTVEIEHLYIEKKMQPLNLYLKEASPEDAETVLNDYAVAIKQLAAVNIFPGDMLLKNFGVTRLRRIVFYDYDEIGFLTDYQFRDIPAPRTEEDEFAAEPWYHVGPMDIFPEEFPRFLFANSQRRQYFLQNHGELFTAQFWQHIQNRLKAGEIVDVFPYQQHLRFGVS